MFGANKVSGPMRESDGSLIINEIFPTLQGEGPDAGRPAVFVRLSHCNLRCFFCDTEFEKGEKMSLDEVFSEIIKAATHGMTPIRLVVITGGEPLLQNIIPLVHKLNANGFAVSIETAGTVWLDHLEEYFAPDRSIAGNLIVCSPKTPVLAKRLQPLIGALKYLIKFGEFSFEDGLPNASTQIKGHPARIYRPNALISHHCLIYVQAVDEYDQEVNAQNLSVATEIARNYGYRLSVQVHKIAGLR